MVITGRGAISCLGNDLKTLQESLRSGRSGVVFKASYRDLDFRSQIAAPAMAWRDALKEVGIKKRVLLTMSDVVQMGVLSAHKALLEEGLTAEALLERPSAIVAGTGVPCIESIHEGRTRIDRKESSKISPYTVLKAMSNALPAALSTMFPVRGPSFSMASACSTSSLCIAQGFDMIRHGMSDLVLCGGAEHLTDGLTGAFDAMRGALSTEFNADPEAASRPFDRQRDGFVMGEGAGMLVSEALESALDRGAQPLAELVGYSMNSDGFHVIQPDPEGKGAQACMALALECAGIKAQEVDYVNPHGTSIPQGDVAELKAIRELLGDQVAISSSKSMTGHPIAAAGVLELIHCSLMLEHQFILPNINLKEIDEGFESMNIVTKSKQAELNYVMSNNFGFGGNNVSLVLKRYV